MKVLAFGVMEGVGGYLSGIALSVTAETILKMIGMNGNSTNKSFDTIYTIISDNMLLFASQ